MRGVGAKNLMDGGVPAEYRNQGLHPCGCLFLVFVLFAIALIVLSGVLSSRNHF